MSDPNDDQLRRIAADTYHSARRRGWLFDPAQHPDPNIIEQEYVEQFVEKNKDRDIDELEECADVARPSNMPTAFERDLMCAVQQRRKELGAKAGEAFDFLMNGLRWVVEPDGTLHFAGPADSPQLGHD
jgi:hypothetical protein